jgi:uncharacterized membrane protein
MDQTRPIRFDTFAEKLFNSIPCGSGALLSVAARVILAVDAARRRDVLATVSFAICGSFLAILGIAIQPMLAIVPAGLLHFLFAGGLFYTFGIFFYAVTSLLYRRSVWQN